MRLMSFRRADGTPSWGLVEGKEVVDCGALAPTLRAALASGKIGHRARRAARVSTRSPSCRPSPTPTRSSASGSNYLTHILEGGRDVPKQPTIFTRFANTQIGHLQPLIRPAASETLDFEGEMAVVIGKAVPPREARRRHDRGRWL